MPLVQQNHVFIDPESCGSSIGYYIHIEEYKSRDKTEHSLRATVVLSDCAHKIDWSFDGLDSDAKIDAAIKMLQEFKKKYTETGKLVKQLSK